MESSYGVGVTNRFAIPDEEDVEVDDPTDIIHSAEKKAIEQKKEVKKNPVPKGKAAEKPQSKSAATDRAPKGKCYNGNSQLIIIHVCKERIWIVFCFRPGQG